MSGLTLVNLNSSGKSLIDVFLSLASKDNLSNIARFGAQLAGYQMALDHPVFGVGLGQYGFRVADYIPDWALVSEEIRKWISPTEGTAWAPVHNIYVRIASEGGFIGLLLWISMWGSVLLGCIRKYRSNTVASGQPDYLGLALVVSIVGVLLSGFNADSFRFFGYWLSLGAAWAYISQTNSQSFVTRAG
jgi:O-antigen ligase